MPKVANYKDFIHQNMGGAFSLSVGLSHILLNSYALGYRHVQLVTDTDFLMAVRYTEEEISRFRSFSYSLFTYLKCPTLILTAPEFQAKVLYRKQEAAFTQLIRLAKALMCKAVVLNTIPNLQTTPGCSYTSVVNFLRKMLNKLTPDIPVYLETSAPWQSHIGDIRTLHQVTKDLGEFGAGVVLDTRHVKLWQYEKSGLPMSKLDWILLKWAENIQLVDLRPSKPYKTLEEENDTEKILSLVPNYPVILNREKLSDQKTDLDYIVATLKKENNI